LNAASSYTEDAESTLAGEAMKQGIHRLIIHGLGRPLKNPTSSDESMLIAVENEAANRRTA